MFFHTKKFPQKSSCCRARARAEYPPKKTNGEHANRAPFSKRRRRPGSSFFFSFLRSSSRASVHAKGTTFIPPKGGKTLERHCVRTIIIFPLSLFLLFACSHRLTKVFFFFFSQRRAMGKMPSSASSLFHQSRRRRLKERRKESDIIIIIRKRRLRLDGRLQFEILCKRRSRPLVLFPQRRASKRLKESLRWNNRTGLPLPREEHRRRRRG